MKENSEEIKNSKNSDNKNKDQIISTKTEEKPEDEKDDFPHINEKNPEDEKLENDEPQSQFQPPKKDSFDKIDNQDRDAGDESNEFSGQNEKIKKTNNPSKKNIDNEGAKNKEIDEEKIKEYKRNHFKKKGIEIIKNPPCSFFWVFFLLILHIIVTYLIKPITTILQIVLITKYNDLKNSEFDYSIQDRLGKIYRIIAWLIIFLIPLVHFFMRGIPIIKIQKSCIRPIYYILFLLIEIEFQVPLTFLYSENFHSIFLYGEEGVGRILNSWLIFFPTDYIISVVEFFRQVIDSIYFFILFYKHFDNKEYNYYQKNNINFLIIGMTNNCIIFISSVVYLSIRVRRACDKREVDSQKNEKNGNFEQKKKSVNNTQDNLNKSTEENETSDDNKEKNKTDTETKTQKNNKNKNPKNSKKDKNENQENGDVNNSQVKFLKDEINNKII